MSFCVISEGEENGYRSRIAKQATFELKEGSYGTDLDIAVDKVRIHLDSGDVELLKSYLEDDENK